MEDISKKRLEQQELIKANIYGSFTNDTFKGNTLMKGGRGSGPHFEKRDPYIDQTAKDYDMDYEDVKKIKEMHPNNFYEKLEEYIKERAKK